MTAAYKLNERCSHKRTAHLTYFKHWRIQNQRIHRDINAANDKRNHNASKSTLNFQSVFCLFILNVERTTAQKYCLNIVIVEFSIHHRCQSFRN